MPMPSYQSVFEKEREKDEQKSKSQPDATQAAANSAQSRSPSWAYGVPSYQPLARPPSQGGLSPSMMPRQPMGPIGPGTDQRHAQEQSFLSEIVRIPPNLVSQLKQELGLDGKEPSAMTFDEKRRLVEAHRQRSVARGNPSSSNGGASVPSSAPTDMPAALFTPDFIQSVANSLDEFDPSFLRPDGDINFERDFGQWFNHPDDVGGALDSR